MLGLLKTTTQTEKQIPILQVTWYVTHTAMCTILRIIVNIASVLSIYTKL